MLYNPQSSKNPNWRDTPQKKGFFGSVIEQSNESLAGPGTAGKRTIGGKGPNQIGGKPGSAANRSQSAIKTVGRHV